ncbi:MULTISPECIES: monovalent cation/H+ antiporter subunit E [Corynebacterium]|uniref:monovalent cation/H+ antiporter subunit E n=1 Tax=Corynebacterium TaxID=1716 RepID=UPI001F30A487|nr:MULTISPECIES: monovalent cation/H+ antiporter subunit E [Corynebacterium]
MLHAMKYTLWIIKEIFVAGWAAVVAAFKPRTGLEPVIIYYPLRLKTDWEIFWFSTSITVTPGTLSVGLRHRTADDAAEVLIVQAAFGADPVDVIEGLADMEEHVNPKVKAIPFDAASVAWEPYKDHGAPTAAHVPPAERMD